MSNWTCMTVGGDRDLESFRCEHPPAFLSGPGNDNTRPEYTLQASYPELGLAIYGSTGKQGARKVRGVKV